MKVIIVATFLTRHFLERIRLDLHNRFNNHQFTLIASTRHLQRRSEIIQSQQIVPEPPRINDRFSPETI